jgi:long-chain acyl-CoA synthetase
MLTLQQLAQQLKPYGRRPCVGLREDLGLRWWSYERLDLGLRQAAVILRRAGVGKGDCVLIRGANCPEWVAFFLGAALRGAVVVPLDHDSPPELVQRIAARTRPKVFLNSGEVLELRETLTLDLNCLHGEPQHATLDDLLVPVSPADPVVVFFTSGTTASPRGVILTHGNIASSIHRFRRWRWITRRIPVRIAVMLPMSHAQGILLGMAIPLSLGLSTIYTCSSHPGYLLRLLRDNRVMILSTVPRVLHVLSDLFLQQHYGKGPATLANKLENVRSFYVRRHYIFTHMRRVLAYRFWVVFVGGAQLPEPDERFWHESGCFLVQGYGLTEASAIVSVNTPWSGAFGSVGKPLAHQEVRIAEDGEVLVRGPNVMVGYAGEDDSDAFSKGFLRTGDIGHLDRRKRLYITGRKKEVIVTSEGFNVHASDIEAAFHGVPGVRDSLVVGLERDSHTQVHAVLLLDDGVNATDIVSRANGRLLGHQRIQSWTVWPDTDFPRSNLLKPRRKIIEERLRAQGQPPTPGSQQEPDFGGLLKIENKRQRLWGLAHYMKQIRSMPPEQCKLDLVRHLGLNSLDIVEFILLLEKESGKVLEYVPTGENTLGGLHSLLWDPVHQQRVHGRDPKDPPRWPALPGFPWLRSFINPPVLYTWMHLAAKLDVAGRTNLIGLRGPVIFTVKGHEHGFDAVLIYCSLPSNLRRRLALVMSRLSFDLRSDPETSLRERFRAILGLKFLLPLFFPYVLTSHFERTRECLLEACRLVDRGFSLVAFEGPGAVMVAKQCGIPIVPVRLAGNDGITFKPRWPRLSVSVSFGQPIDATPGVPGHQLIGSVKEFSPGSRF